MLESLKNLGVIYLQSKGMLIGRKLRILLGITVVARLMWMQG